MRQDRRRRAMGQALVHGEGLVGGGQHLGQREAHHVRQVLTAVFLGHVEAGPAAFLDLLERVPEALGRAHDPVFEGAALLVADRVQGKSGSRSA